MRGVPAFIQCLGRHRQSPDTEGHGEGTLLISRSYN